MRRLLQAALLALGIYCGCSKSEILNPAAFTSEFASALQKSSPGLKVEIINDLQLKVTGADGQESTSFLDNAYDTYKQDPKSKNEIFQRFVAADLETMAGMHLSKKLDRTRIVPIVKDRPWLEETKKAMLSRGAHETPETVYEDLNSDLVILYAEDSAQSIRYLSPKDLEGAHIERKDLRNLACENLQRLLPKVERHGANGLYMLTAGGNYEASLLLFDPIWKGIQNDVEGEIVVAIPTRDLLLVTGSRNAQGIEKMKQMIQQSAADGSYRLTTKLFVFHEGKLVEFVQ